MKNSDPLLNDTGRGFSVLYKGRQLYSPADPEKRAILRSDQIELQNDTLYFLSSPLLFYGVKELLSRLPDTSHLICFEFSDTLYELSKNHIPEFFLDSSRFTFIYSTNPTIIFKTVEKMGVWNFRRVKAVNLSGGYSLHAPEYKNILKRIDINIQEYWKNRMTLIHMGPLWIKNIFLNLYKTGKHFKKTTIYKHPQIDCPILVTGAGESLEKSINFIIENKDYIKILAVDTSISVLLQNGIEPDYIIAVDAQIYNFYDFLSVNNKQIPLFFDITGYNGIPAVLNGPVFLFISNFADTMLLKRLEQFNLMPTKVPALGSVGLTAIYMALQCTKNHVFYTGLDFAYKIGKSHANGSPRNLSELTLTTRLNPMEQPGIYYARPLIKNIDKNGITCNTDIILASYAELMNDNFGNTDRLFDLGVSGLNSGGKLLKTSNLYFNNKCGDTIFQENKDKLNNFKDFCRNELKLINELYDSVYSYIAGTSKNGKKIINLLIELDYLYLHFPDKSPEPSLDPGFLKRILISCGYYSNIIKRYI